MHREDRIAELRELIRDEDLLVESEEDQPTTAEKFSRVRFPWLLYLGQQARRALDRSHDQLWEEHDEQREVEEVRDGLESPPMDVDRVAERLERVERDAHRDDQVLDRPRHLEPK